MVVYTGSLINSTTNFDALYSKIIQSPNDCVVEINNYTTFGYLLNKGCYKYFVKREFKQISTLFLKYYYT